MDTRTKVRTRPVPPYASARFEADNQGDRTVSLNLELYDASGEWLDNEPAEFRTFGPNEQAAAREYEHRLILLADALNNILGLKEPATPAAPHGEAGTHPNPNRNHAKYKQPAAARPAQ